ncbi:DciA family protein [Marinobacter bohaiensis]|uniref:DciA family protein n=1 Tax=Marinobacter bohaiensis TaxID=2201898 RepID=UPI000DABFC20|nr:DciA family protein [Marinobacter bohaiensis]
MRRKTNLSLEPSDTRHPPNLRRLLAHAEVHRRAEQVVLHALPDNLRNHCRFLSYHDGDLALSAESSMTASQLRLRQREILEVLRKEPDFQHAWRLKVKVAPPRPKRKPVYQKEALSKENARLLDQEAGHTKDEGLREVLEKLSRHVKD